MDDMTLHDYFHRHWVCVVVRSGFHNGAECRPEDPHGGWDCGWRHEASLTDEAWQRVTEVGRLTP